MNAHSLRVLEFDRIRDALVDRATFAGGARRLRDLTPVVGDTVEVSRRLDCTSEIRRILEDSDLPIHGLPDLSATLKEAEPPGSVLSAARIAPVAKSLQIVQRMLSFLHGRRETLPRLWENARGLEALGELRAEIESRIDPAGEVLDGATSALKRLRREQETVRQQILRALERVVRSLAASGADPVVTLRGGRYVIGARRDRLGDLRGVVHGRSGSGASVYMEPTSVVPRNNDLAELRSAEEEEIRRILTELTESIRSALPALEQNEETLAELDTFYASGRFSRDLDAIPALAPEDGSIAIRKGRHPLLEMSTRGSGHPTVPLELNLGGEHARTLVITGPNTGGKTVALKTVGLFALMNQAGLHLPAGEGTSFPPLREVFADIGDEQSIEASLSTFSSHMSHVNEVLREADERTLVLLDELGVGTDPEEGAALGRAILSELTRARALTVVTTHYGSLKVFAHKTSGMENASLEFDRETLSPTYRFLQGVPGSSEALSIAQRLGFPPRLVDEARQTLGSDREAVEGLLHDLQGRRRELAEAREELGRERSETQRLREEAERKLAGLKKERAQAKRRALDEARRLVERSKAELSAILGAVRSNEGGGKAADRARSRLGEMGSDLEREMAQSSEATPTPRRAARPEEIEEGTAVYIPKMSWSGTALGPPASNGKVGVEVGSVRVEVPISALEIREGGRRPRGTRTNGGKVPAPARPELSESEVKTEIDLRGRTVDEAVTEVDRTLDGLVVAGGTWVRIIHGKGTGALRAAITEHLADDERVKSFRHGEPAEGGSGVTIAVLK